MNTYTEIEEMLSELISKILEDQTELKRYQNKGKFKFTPIIGAIPDEKLPNMIPAYSVRVVKGKNTVDSYDLKTKVTIGIYDEDSQAGYNKIRELLEKILDGVISEGLLGKVVAESPYTGKMPQIKGKYEILTEADVDIYEDQPYPFWVGSIMFNIRPISKYRKDLESWRNIDEIF